MCVIKKLLIILVFILIVAGCSKQAPEERKPIVELTFGSFLNGMEFDEEIVQPIAKKFPHIKLRLSRNLDKGYSFGDLSVDVLHSMTGGEFSYSDYMFEPYFPARDLSAWLNTQTDPTMNIPTELWNHARMIGKNGTVSVVPYTRMLYALYYDPQKFAQYGISIPQEPITWEALIQINTQLPMDKKNWFGPLMIEAMLDQLSTPLIKTSYSEKYVDERLALIVQIFNQIANGAQGTTYTTFNDYNKSSLDYMLFLTSHLAEQPSASRTYSGVSLLLSNPRLDVLNFPGYSLDQLMSPPRAEEILRMNDNISPAKEQAALDVISYMISEEFQVQNAKNGLGPVINSYEAIEQFGNAIPELEHKNTQAFFTTQLASYPEDGQLMEKDSLKVVQRGMYEVVAQLLMQKISSEDALKQLKQLFDVFME
jgi:multiple sugar transport system substrate-binding protein